MAIRADHVHTMLSAQHFLGEQEEKPAEEKSKKLVQIQL